MIIAGIDKSTSLADCKRTFFRHLSKTGEAVGGVNATKAEFAIAHNDLWESITAEDMRAAISGDASTAVADDFILFIVAQCAAIQLEQHPTLT
jgi:hypothetical protein